MSVHNEILVGRFSRSVQKLFGMKGPAAVRQLSGEIMPVHSIMHGRENRYLEDWRTFGGHAQQAAVAAQDTVIRFGNPAGSNIIAVIESLTVWSSTSNVEFVIEHDSSSNNPALANSFTPASFDSRWKPPGTGTNGAACVLSSTNNIGQGAHVIAYDIATGAVDVITNELINYEQQEITLLPGADLQFRSLTLNVLLTVNIRWRERFLEDSERT